MFKKFSLEARLFVFIVAAFTVMFVSMFVVGSVVLAVVLFVVNDVLFACKFFAAEDFKNSFPIAFSPITNQYIYLALREGIQIVGFDNPIVDKTTTNGLITIFILFYFKSNNYFRL